MNKHDLRKTVMEQLGIQQGLLAQYQAVRVMGRLEGAVQALEMVLGLMDAPAAGAERPSPQQMGEEIVEGDDGK